MTDGYQQMDARTEQHKANLITDSKPVGDLLGQNLRIQFWTLVMAINENQTNEIMHKY